MSVVVKNKPTLCSPLVFSAYKNGVRVPFGTILNPNSGLSSYSQFDAVFHTCLTVQHALKIFNEKVEAALRLQKCCDTADFVQFVLN